LQEGQKEGREGAGKAAERFRWFLESRRKSLVMFLFSKRGKLYLGFSAGSRLSDYDNRCDNKHEKKYVNNPDLLRTGVYARQIVCTFESTAQSQNLLLFYSLERTLHIIPDIS